METQNRINPNNAARQIRSKMAVDFIKQTSFCKEHGFSRDIFNKFLRRKVNMLDKDIIRALEILNINR